MPADSKIKDYMYYGINLMIVIDILLIFYLFLCSPSQGILSYIIAFDVLTCIILLFDYSFKLNRTSSKIRFLNENWIFIIASLPLELIFPVYTISFRFLLLMKLLRISVVSGIINRYFGDLARFFENTRIDNIFLGVIIIVIIFTFAIYALDPGLNLFDSLWYVVVTLTTVGYGDVTPNTFSAKVISLMLLIIGIFVFSTLTGAISSFFTDKILDIDSDVEENMDVLNRKIDNLDSEIKTVRKELELSRAENKKLQDKIDELLKK